MERIELSKYVVSDFSICQGLLTFKDTQIMVGPVLEMFAHGYTMEDILRKYPNLTREMVKDAQLLAVEYWEKDFPGKPQPWEENIMKLLENATDEDLLRMINKETKVEGVEFGKYIIANPHVCHEQLTFKGTRVMVGPILEMFAHGDTIEDILAGYWSLTREMIEEAQLLAVQYLEKDFPAKPQMWKKDISLSTKELVKWARKLS